MAIQRLGFISQHETVFALESDLMKIARPFRRVKQDGAFTKKGGLYVYPLKEVQYRMDERDIAVGALKMIAGEVDKPAGLKNNVALAKDALAAVRAVGIEGRTGAALDQKAASDG